MGRECHCAGNPETTPKPGKAPPCLLEKGSGYSLRAAEALWVPAAAFCCHGTLPWLSIFLLQLFFLCSTLPDLRICVGDPDERVGVFSIHMYSGTEEVQSHLTSSFLHSELLPRSLCLREVTEEQSISKGKDTGFTAWPAPGEALPLRVLSASPGVGTVDTGQHTRDPVSRESSVAAPFKSKRGNHCSFLCFYFLVHVCSTY